MGREKPEQITSAQWAGYLSYRSEPQPTAADVDALLSSDDPPRVVMIEELHNQESAAFIAALADALRVDYPQWQGRWGAFIGFGHYALLSFEHYSVQHLTTSRLGPVPCD